MDEQSYFHFPLDLMKAMERSGDYILYPSVDLSSFYCVLSRQNGFCGFFVLCIPLTWYNRVFFDQFLWEILWSSLCIESIDYLQIMQGRHITGL